MFLNHNIFLRKMISKIYQELTIKNILLVRHTSITNVKFPACFCHSTQSSEALSKKDDSDGNLQKTWLENILPTFEKSLILGDLKESDLMMIFRRFELKGLDIDTLKKYDVRVSYDFRTLLFPFCSLEKKLSAVQTMVYNEDLEENITQSFSGLDDQVLFGWSLVGSEHEELVVTSDPLDAIAVNQSANIPAVSLPFINSLQYVFSLKLLSLLNAFNKIIFWMKPDMHDWENHKLLGSTLKRNGYFVRPRESQHPMFYLRNGSDIRQILRKTYPLYDPRLKDLDEFEEEVYEELDPEKVSGLKWKRFEVLNDILKGHRTGELTIFSGQTGTGKTTFMCEYSLDLCLQGRRTLWINLEIPHPRLLRTMLCQFARCSPKELRPAKKIWYKKFKENRMTILNFSNCYSLNGILDVMLNAVHLRNIEHIIVDNLQFMMYMSGSNSIIDHLRRQDQTYSKFREFASNQNCHVTVIIHPRKEPDYTELTISSISGTAKATQEADNILILQTTKTRQYLEVTKNRFDGEKGCVLLEFDKSTYTYTVKKVISKTKSMSIVKSDE